MWLVGMMGSGKTTVGREVAAREGVGFYDTDEMIEAMSKMRISAIWDGVGEQGFRELERRVISTVPFSGFVAAAGGGAVLSSENREHMRRGKPVIWLRASPDQLAARLEDDGSRPLLEGLDPIPEQIAALLQERSDLYSQVATDLVETGDRKLEEVISDVVEIWRR